MERFSDENRDLEKILPLVFFPLLLFIVLNAKQPKLFLLFGFVFIAINLSFSKLSHSVLSLSLEVSEPIKASLNVVYVVVLLAYYGKSNHFWMLHLLSIMRLFVLNESSLKQKIFVAILCISPVLGLWWSGEPWMLYPKQ